MARAALLLFAWLILAPPAPAQTVAEQRERVAALRERLRGLEAETAARDSATRAARRLDTLRVGGFIIVTDSGGSERLRVAADSAWAIVSRELALTPETFRGRQVFARFGRLDANWSDLVRRGDQSFDGNASEAGLRSRLLAASGAMAADRAGRRVGLWTGAGLGLQYDRDALRWRALVEMVTATAPAGRACNAGDMAACADALWLGPDADAEFTDWNDPEARRRAVRERYRPSDSVTAARRDECLSGQSDFNCWRILQESGLAGRIGGHAPFSSENASGVLRTAARLGGAGAFDRLVADTSAPLARRLEAMAGVPVDSILRAWWSDARGIQHPPVRVPARTQWATLLWTLAFAGLALRSTRWR